MTSTETDASAASTAIALAGLHAWLAQATGMSVATELPDGQGQPRLCVWPMRLLPDQEVRGGPGRSPLRLRARYLVAAAGPIDAAIGLLDLVLAALAGQDRYRLVLDPVPGPSTTAPQPAVFIDVPVTIATPEAERASLVTGGLRLDGGAVRSISGSLVGPGDVALPGMTVASPATGTSVRTGPRGEFVLPGQPGGRAVVLQLSGRGLHLQVEVAPQATGPVVVHCPIEEV